MKTIKINKIYVDASVEITQNNKKYIFGMYRCIHTFKTKRIISYKAL